MIVVMAGAVVVVDVMTLVPDTGLRPRVNPTVAPVVAAAVVAVEADVDVEVTAPNGLSMKDKPPLAVVAAGAVLVATEVGPMGKAKPVPTTGAALEAGAANRDGAVVGATMAVTGGAGVVDGLMPRGKPPDWLMGAAEVVVVAG